jgi:hypothetical protein
MSVASVAPVAARRVLALMLLLAGASSLAAAPSAFAASAPVGLGTADSFAVLAGSGITNTGDTSITGDVGSLPTPSETGFASVTLTGTDHGGDPVTAGAKDDLGVAYDDAAGRAPSTPRPGELGGSTVVPGIYSSASFSVAGTLTLDAEGDTDAEFIFQAGSTVTAASNSRITLINGADPCRVVWQVGSSATFNTGSEFVGNVLVRASITAQTGATFRGRLLALDGAVTLDTNTITKADCPAADPPATAAPAVPASTPAAAVATTTGTGSGPASGAEGSAPGVPATGAAPAPSTMTVDSSRSPAADLVSPTTLAGSLTSTTDVSPRWALSTPREISIPRSAPPFLSAIGSPMKALMVTALALLAAGAVGLGVLVAGRRRRAAVATAPA